MTFIWINDWSRLVLAMNDALRAGHSLAMQCDRPEYSSKLEGFEFFGARRMFPFTIYHLAIMHGLPVIFSYAVPDEADPEITVVHMPPMFHPQPDSGSRAENFAAAHAHFQTVLATVEPQLRRTPYLWFNFTPMNPPCAHPTARPPDAHAAGRRSAPSAACAPPPTTRRRRRMNVHSTITTGTLPPAQAPAALCVPLPRGPSFGRAEGVRLVPGDVRVCGVRGAGIDGDPGVRGARRLRAGPPPSARLCQGVIHWGVSWYARFTEAASASFTSIFPKPSACGPCAGTIFAPEPRQPDRRHPFPRAAAPADLRDEKKHREQSVHGRLSSCLAGYLPKDHGTEFIRRGRDALLEGSNLLIFPEGTRTLNPPVNRFKSGFALMATLADAPVQTVFIEMPVLFLGKNWPFWSTPPLPMTDPAAVGRAVPCAAGPERESVQRGLGSVLPARTRPHGRGRGKTLALSGGAIRF